MRIGNTPLARHLMTLDNVVVKYKLNPGSSSVNTEKLKMLQKWQINFIYVNSRKNERM